MTRPPLDTPSSRRRELLGKLALAAAATLVGLALAEAGLRLTGLASARRGAAWYAGGNHPRYLFEPDRRLGYRLRPDFHGRDVALSGEFDVAVETDAHGLRRRGETGDAGARPGGVLAVGDSLTFGEGVAADETFAAHLEDRLGVPVADAGVPGYSSRQAVSRAERLAPILRPRMVLLTLSAPWDESRCAHPFVYKEGYIVGSRYADRLHLIGDNLVLEQVHHPWLGPLSVSLMRHSHLLRLALPALRQVLVGRGSGGGPPGAQAWRPCLAAIAAARERLAAGGAELLVVLAESPDEPSRAATERVDAALTGAGIPHVLLDDLFGGADLALRYPGDHHWNRLGHERVAEALAPEIRKRLAAAATSASPPPRTGAAGTARPAPAGTT